MSELGEKELKDLKRAINFFNNKIESLSKSSKYKDVVLPYKEDIYNVLQRISDIQDYEREISYLSSIKTPKITRLGGFQTLETTATQINRRIQEFDFQSFITNSQITPRHKFKSKSDLKRYLQDILYYDSTQYNHDRSVSFREYMVDVLYKIGLSDVALDLANMTPEEVDRLYKKTNEQGFYINKGFLDNIPLWYSYSKEAKNELHQELRSRINRL